MRRLLPLLLCVPLSRCGSAPPVETSFVFAVVPGLPADFANRASSPIGPAASLSALFEVADQLPGTEERPNFIIIAGVSREGVAETARDSAVTRAVATLRRSTIRRVLLVPVGAARRDTSIWAAISGSAAFAGVELKDLTRCYGADTLRDDACSVDVENSRLRIVAFPSFALTADTTVNKRVPAWVGILDTLVTHAGLLGRSVVLVTDTPDPTLWESMGVDPAAVARFNRIAMTRVVSLIGVRQRSSQHLYRMQDRSIATPPLSSVNGSDTVLGFTLLHVRDNSVRPQVFRRHTGTLTFSTAALSPDPMSARPGLIKRAIGSLQTLTQTADLLAFWAVIAIAAIVAFLTIVQLWEIPPVNAPAAAAPPAPASSSSTGSGGAPAASVPPASTNAIVLFRGNMARAVTAGLSGLLLVSFLDDFWKSAGFNAKALYLVVFVGLFFVVLAGSAALRAIGEGWRHLLVTPRPHPIDEPKTNAFLVFGRWLGRIGKSVFSSALVAYDTFLAAFQGQNQFQSRVWAKAIVDQHRSMLTVAETLRSDIDRRIRDMPAVQALNPGPGAIRVNVSLESNDHKGLYYVRWAPGSLQRAFGEKSVANLAVVTGQPLWWKQTYVLDQVVLVDNAKQVPCYRNELPERQLKLSEYFETRAARDYASFLVIPFPFHSRGTEPARRGGIHFSFVSTGLMDALIENLEIGPAMTDPNYGCCQHLLETAVPAGTFACDTKPGNCASFVRFKDPNVATAIRYSLNVFESLFATFDDDVYNEYRTRL